MLRSSLLDLELFKQQFTLNLRYFELHTSIPVHAGHSKWANIRHIKALKDKQKSANFTKFARQIRLAIQDGGTSNTTLNSSLRTVIEIATKKNMPMASIQNVIKKCDKNRPDLKKYILEIRLLNKIFIVCVIYTDGLTTFKMNLTPVLKKHRATFVNAKYLFDDQGIIEASVKKEIKDKAVTPVDLEKICVEHAIDCGAEDVETLDFATGTVNFLCDPIEMERIVRYLNENGYTVENFEHCFVPKTLITITDDEAKNLKIFLEKLKQFDEIEDIYDNVNT